MLKYKKCIFLITLLFIILANNKINIAEGEIIDGMLATVVMDKFDGGLDTDTSSNKLLFSQSPYLANVDYDETNSLTTRKGLSLTYTLPVSTTVLLNNSFVANYDDGSSEFIIQAGSGVYSTTGNNVWTTIVNGVSTLYPMNFVLHYKRVFMSNGVDNVGVWDKYTQIYSTYSFIPKGRYLLTDKTQLLISGTFENPSNVYFSEIESEGILSDNWDGNYWIECGKGDGDIITGLFKQDGRVYITKKGSIYGLLTTANYVKAERILYSDLYGCVSNKSINNWKTGKILLNRYGLYFYDGGRDWEFIGKNLKKNLTDNIGLLNTNEGRWTTTSTADFSTGTFSNCFNDNGTVIVTTASYIWDTNDKFNTAYTGSTQQSIKDNSVSISSYAGTGSGNEEKVSLDWYDNSPNSELFEHEIVADNWIKDYALTSTHLYSQNQYRPASWSYVTDTEANSYAVLNSNQSNGSQDIRVRFTINSGVATQISKIQYTYTFCPTILNYPKEINNPQDAIINEYYRFENLITIANLATMKTDRTYKVTYPFSNKWLKSETEINPIWVSNGINNIIINYDKGLNKPIKYTSIIDIKNNNSTIYNDADKGKPEAIELYFRFVLNPFSNTYSIPNYDFIYGYQKGIGLRLWDISAWKIADANSVYYSSAIYISPIYNTGYTSPAYDYLYPSDDLGVGISTGTIAYTVRTSTASDMGNATAWYSLGIASATNTAIDGKQYFQYKAELWTSTPTIFTPTIFKVELQYNPYGYGTYISTYTSKVMNVGQNLTSWGSFVGDTDGTVAFRIRSATWSFNPDISEATIAYSNISSGDNITISTNSTYIQWQGRMSSKDATINGVSITWEEGSAGGGSQDVASINYQDKYYLAYSTWASYNTDVLIFDKNGKFTRYDWDVANFAVFNNKFYILSSTMPYIYQVLTGVTDNGQPINFVYETGDMDFGNADRKKEIINIYLTGKKQTGSWVRLKTYVNSSTTATDNFYCDLGSYNNFRLVCSDKTYGKNIKYILTSTATVNVEINGINNYLLLKDLQE